MEGFNRVSIPLELNYSTESAIKYQIGKLKVWVCRSNEDLDVFFDECAHMGNSLESNGTQLVCPQHGWTYDFNGRNLQSGGPSLRKARVVSITDSTIEVLLPSKSQKVEKVKLKHPLVIQIHSHATLELNYRGSSVIFDPWLEGPAYYGAWHLHPKPAVTAGELKVEAIVITHPHPDHFHLPTLEKMDKSVPIYFPQFPSQLIEEGLNQLGFVNQNPMFWGETFSVGNYFRSRFLRPRSMWEDSATYTWIEDGGIVFNWLNLVDAGAVIDESSIPNLDLLTSAFDQGASGYPLTWTHLSEKRKIKILEEQKKNNLTKIPFRAEKLNARYFLPFAGHWRLGLDIHQKYARMIPHTTFQELSDSFDINAPHCNFLSLYPGQSVDFLSPTIDGYSGQFLKLDDVMSDPVTTDGMFLEGIQQDVIDKFRTLMSNLADMGEAFNCENVELTVSVLDCPYTETFHFNSSEMQDDEKIKISVQIPNHILSLLSVKKANWDHVAIGYWGSWTRSPDRYPANFMRLLQAGYPKPEITTGVVSSTDFEFILQKTVGDIIEIAETIAPKLLSRLGLPCLSCIRSNSETLAQAMEIHSIDISSNSWILKELASRYSSSLGKLNGMRNC
jgi:CMP-N-acetylneuraminate monooxygenase